MTSSGESDYYAAPVEPNICLSLANFRLLHGAFLEIMIRHFADPSNIENSALRNAIWKKTDDTGILVKSSYDWDPKTTEGRPAIILKRNACQNRRISVGNVRQGPSQDMYGHEHFLTVWTGSHTLFCLGGNGAQAELLASEVQKELTEFALPISKKLGILRIEVLEVGPPAKIEEAKESFGVPVVVGYAYEERWVLREEAPTLKKIDITVSTLLGC